MAKVLSLDLRRRVAAAVHAGSSRRQAAARFGVGVSSAIRWVAQARATGDLAPKRRGGAGRASRIGTHASLILGWISVERDLTLAEIAARLDAAVGYRPPPSVVRGFFKRHGVTQKRRRTPLSRIGRT
jgi:transposase